MCSGYPCRACRHRPPPACCSSPPCCCPLPRPGRWSCRPWRSAAWTTIRCATTSPTRCPCSGSTPTGANPSAKAACPICCGARRARRAPRSSLSAITNPTSAPKCGATANASRCRWTSRPANRCACAAASSRSPVRPRPSAPWPAAWSVSGRARARPSTTAPTKTARRRWTARSPSSAISTPRSRCTASRSAAPTAAPTSTWPGPAANATAWAKRPSKATRSAPACWRSWCRGRRARPTTRSSCWRCRSRCRSWTTSAPWTSAPIPSRPTRTAACR